MKFQPLATALAFSCLCSTAMAEPANSNWVGIGYASIDHDFAKPVKGDGKHTDELLLKFGKQLNEHFALEFRGGKTIGGSSSVRNGVEMDFHHNHWVGGWLRAGMTAGMFRPYVLAGGTRIKDTASVGGDNQSNTISGFSWAAGNAFLVGEQLSLDVEFLMLSNTDKNARQGLQFAANWHF